MRWFLSLQYHTVSTVEAGIMRNNSLKIPVCDLELLAESGEVVCRPLHQANVVVVNPRLFHSCFL